jgi:hypothetical protein
VAGPIKISVLADVGQAVKSVTKFSDTVDSETKRVVTSLGDSKLTAGWGKIQEGFDVADTRAMGFRDTITGVQDTMTGFQGLLGNRKPGQTFADSMLQVGMGVGDLASGFANFLVPMAAVISSLNATRLASLKNIVVMAAQKVAMIAGAVVTGVMTAAQWALNVALNANPIGLVVLAIALLVAGLVLAYKRSATFRAIVQALGATFMGAVGAVRNFVVGAVQWIAGLPGKVSAIFSRLKTGLSNIGRDMVSGLVSGIEGAWHWVTDKVSYLTNLIPSAVRNLLGIQSPSKVFMKIGHHIGTGFAIGLDRARIRVKAAAQKLLDLTTLRNDYAKTIKDALGGNRIADLIDPTNNPLGYGASVLATGLEMRLAAIQRFQSGLEVLRRKGFGESIVQSIAGAGVEKGQAFIDQLRGASVGEVKHIKSLDRSLAIAGSAFGARQAQAQFQGQINAATGGVNRQVVIRIESSGSKTDDFLVELLRQRIRVAGGNVQRVLGR